MSGPRDEIEDPYQTTAAKIIDIITSLGLPYSSNLKLIRISDNLNSGYHEKKPRQAHLLATSVAMLKSILSDLDQDSDLNPIITKAINEINALLTNNPLELNSGELIEAFVSSEKIDHSEYRYNDSLQPIVLNIIARQLLNPLNPESSNDMFNAINSSKEPFKSRLEELLLVKFKDYHSQLLASATEQYNHLIAKPLDPDDSLIRMQTYALKRERDTLLAFPELFDPNNAGYVDYINRLLAAHQSLTAPRGKEQKGKTDLQIIKSSRNPLMRKFLKILENLFSYFEKKKESKVQRGHHKFWKPHGYDHAHKAKTILKELGMKGHGKGHRK